MIENKSYLWDKFGTRYQLLKSNSGSTVYNWLFLPGGPGADSRYFKSLIEIFDMPGNYWLIDLPNNGDNVQDSGEYNFDRWSECFLPCLQKFDSPILVGHSFGGMFPMLFPELENILKGFVILNSAPCLWLEEAAKKALERGMADKLLDKDITAFRTNPNNETFQKALLACVPYYFPEETRALGCELLKDLPFNYHASNWWFKKSEEINFTAQWVPSAVKTLILSGTEDLIVPYSLFERDARFNRPHITHKVIQGAGHMPWVEKPEEVSETFKQFQKSL